MQLWALLAISCLSAFQLTLPFPSPVPIPAHLHPSSRIPYGAYLQGRAQTATCQPSSATLFALLPSLGPCSLAERLRTVYNLGAKVALISESQGSEVPEDSEMLIVLVTNETSAVLGRYSGMVLRADFSEDSRDQPLWEIATSADLNVRETVMSLSFPNATVQTRDTDPEGTELWINGQAFRGGKGSLERALCASFSYPPAACLLCAPHCWPELLGNGLCDSVCFTPDCQYDYEDCTYLSERRTPYANSLPPTNSTGSSCSTTACAIGVSIAVVVFCLAG